MAKCKGCGAEIVWCGKIPCNLEQMMYWQKKEAKGRIVTPNGEVISCEFHGDQNTATGIGHMPHWATCPAADLFRNRKERVKK